jgi:hypothetical protein
MTLPCCAFDRNPRPKRSRSIGPRNARELVQSTQRATGGSCVVDKPNVAEADADRRSDMLLASAEVRHAPAVEPLADQRFRLFIEIARSPYILRDNQTTPWPQETGRLGIERLLMDRVAETFERPHDVERTIRKRRASIISLLEADSPSSNRASGRFPGLLRFDKPRG